jgi:hypothetical protein
MIERFGYIIVQSQMQVAVVCCIGTHVMEDDGQWCKSWLGIVLHGG